MTPTISELFTALIAARERYFAAERDERAARSAACTALNELNEAQRAYNAAHIELRKSAPGASDWGRTK